MWNIIIIYIVSFKDKWSLIFLIFILKDSVKVNLELGIFIMCIVDNINIFIRGYKVKLKKKIYVISF